MARVRGRGERENKFRYRQNKESRVVDSRSHHLSPQSTSWTRQTMVADWTEATPTWQNPHERSFYRESIPPLHPSFNVGTPQSHPNSNVQYPNSFTGLSKDMEEKQRRLQDALDKVLGPEYVQNRPGGGGTKLTYLEGWRAINLANEVFGYNGQSALFLSLGPPSSK